MHIKETMQKHSTNNTKHSKYKYAWDSRIINKMQPSTRIYYSKIYCSSHPAWTTAGHHMFILTRGCKYSLDLLIMSGKPLETCWAFNKFLNNKFYYKVASCLLFYWLILRCTDQWILNKYTYYQNSFNLLSGSTKSRELQVTECRMLHWVHYE
jgi:hypothetical protein